MAMAPLAHPVKSLRVPWSRPTAPRRAFGMSGKILDETRAGAEFAWIIRQPQSPFQGLPIEHIPQKTRQGCVSCRGFQPKDHRYRAVVRTRTRKPGLRVELSKIEIACTGDKDVKDAETRGGCSTRSGIYMQLAVRRLFAVSKTVEAQTIDVRFSVMRRVST